MDTRLQLINETVRGYDRKLYAKRFDKPYGVMGIFRDSKPTPHLIFALTDDWTVKGKPVQWGIDPILNRLRAHDLWNRGDIAGQLDEERSKADASSRRSLRNSIESFLYEFRSQFARATNEINTSTLEKVDRRRKAHGNC